MEKVIEVKNLTKEYKEQKAVDNLSFDVYEGEILGLLGPNGSGKSTTINSILALLKYQNGSIKIFGKDMKPDSYDIKSKIGVIFQEVAVFNELNVYDNINYFCGLYIEDKNIRKQYVEDAIELVEVEILCDRIIILDKGKIIAQGTSEELKQQANIEEKIERVGPTLNDVFLKLTGKELRD